jgi:hypothetical protein
MMKKLLFFSIFIGLVFSYSSLFASPRLNPNVIIQENVQWENLVNAQVSGNTLSRVSGAIGKGRASSVNILFGYRKGFLNSTLTDGSFSFTSNITNEAKKIGYSSFGSLNETASEIEYGFQFQKNGRVKLFTLDTSITVTYPQNSVFKLERVDNMMRFSINNTVRLEIDVDKSRNLIILSELTSEGSSFTGVTVSYETKRMIVNPTIDHTNNTIKLNIIGSFPPFEYQWDRQETFTYPSSKGDSVHFSKGVHQLSIKDAKGFEYEALFCVGSNVNWTNNVNTAVDSLSLVPSGAITSWGYAISSETFMPDEISFLEYIIEQNQQSKAFGYISTTSPFNRFQHLLAGFLLAKDNSLQIISQGSVVFTTEYYDKDAIAIYRSEDQVQWYRNGKLIYEENLVLSQNLKIGALLKNNTIISGLHYLKRSPKPIVSTWNSSTNLGKVDVNISGLTSEDGPFIYFLTDEPINFPSSFSSSGTKKFIKIDRSTMRPIFDSLQYNNEFVAQPVNEQLKDLIKGIIDFSRLTNLTNDPFNVVSSNTFFSFDNVPSGRYFVTVYDNFQNFVLGDYVTVQPNLILETSNGLTQVDNRIRATQSNAQGTFNYYLFDKVESQVDFEVLRSTQAQRFGYVVSEGSSTILFGFEVANNRYRLIINGQVQSNLYRIKNNTVLSIATKENEMLLLQNGVEMARFQYDIETLYQLQLNLNTLNTLINVTVINGLFIPKKYVRTENVVHATCSNTYGAFNFQITMSGAPRTVNSTLTNLTSQEVLTQNGTTGQVLVYQGLAVGVYTLQVTISPNISYTRTVHIGIEGQFEQLSNFEVTPNTYSLRKDQGGLLDLATARSTNELIETETSGWILYKPEFNGEISANYNILSLGYSTASSPTQLDLTEYFVLSFPLTSNFMFVFVNRPNVGTTSFVTNINNTLKLNINATTVNVQTISPQQVVSSTQYGAYTRPSGDLFVKAFSNRIGSGFNDVVFSFACKKRFVSYIQWEEEISSGHYIAYDSKIGIYFEEEYGVDQGKVLDIKVFDRFHNLVAGTVPALSYRGSEDNTLEENKHILDLSSLNLQVGELYTLELTTVSGEKRYLKFLNQN